jgi:V8-like Glu-specific endopeptidase
MATPTNNKMASAKAPAKTGNAPLEEYWTEERRNSAQVLHMPSTPIQKQPVKRELEITPEITPELERLQQPGHIAPGSGSVAAPHFTTEGTQGTNGGPGGQPVPHPLVYPYRTVGKLFLTQPTGNYAGSAALIGPNLILTAGHCVFYNGGWSTNVAFYPSYGQRAATDPLYKVNYTALGCWTAWNQNFNFEYDYGLIWVDTPLGNSLGWIGTCWNVGTSGRTWDAIGYPGAPNPPFTGGTMDQVSGQYEAASTPGTFILTNDNMSHGSSGGPWITTYNETTPLHANSVSSTVDGNGAIHGPSFTQDIGNLITWFSNPANH